MTHDKKQAGGDLLYPSAYPIPSRESVRPGGPGRWFQSRAQSSELENRAEPTS